MSRLPRLAATVAVSLALLGACGGDNPYSTSDEPTDTASVGVEDNQYLPDRNVSDCVGTLERPNCGSTAKGQPEMYLVMGVLVLGLGFVGWRVVAGVRRRDAVVNAEPTGSGSSGQ